MAGTLRTLMRVVLYVYNSLVNTLISDDSLTARVR